MRSRQERVIRCHQPRRGCKHRDPTPLLRRTLSLCSVSTAGKSSCWDLSFKRAWKRKADVLPRTSYPYPPGRNEGFPPNLQRKPEILPPRAKATPKLAARRAAGGPGLQWKGAPRKPSRGNGQHRPPETPAPGATAAHSPAPLTGKHTAVPGEGMLR